MKLGEKIALCRKKAGLSQEELAEKLGLSRQAVSRWETGAAVPETEKVIQLSRLFQVSTDYLLLEDAEETVPQPKPVEQSAPKAADPVKERRRRFRIVLGLALVLSGIGVAVPALVMAERWAQETTWWHSDMGRFGTALSENWMGGALAFGVLLFLGGAVLLAREYIRKD